MMSTTIEQPAPSRRRRVQILVEMPEGYEGTPEQAKTEVAFLLHKAGLQARAQHMGPFGVALEPLAVISTAHVTPQTMARLAMPEPDQPANLPPPFEGLVHCPTLGDGVFLVVPRDRAELTLYSRGWPPDLRGLMAEAHAAGLQWLKLDGAAQVLKDMPTYPWPDDVDRLAERGTRPAQR
jgi:hypothetical protein